LFAGNLTVGEFNLLLQVVEDGVCLINSSTLAFVAQWSPLNDSDGGGNDKEDEHMGFITADPIPAWVLKISRLLRLGHGQPADHRVPHRQQRWQQQHSQAEIFLVESPLLSKSFLRLQLFSLDDSMLTANAAMCWGCAKSK
jgi:hypothetical protein